MNILRLQSIEGDIFEVNRETAIKYSNVIEQFAAASGEEEEEQDGTIVFPLIHNTELSVIADVLTQIQRKEEEEKQKDAGEYESKGGDDGGAGGAGGAGADAKKQHASLSASLQTPPPIDPRFLHLIDAAAFLQFDVLLERLATVTADNIRNKRPEEICEAWGIDFALLDIETQHMFIDNVPWKIDAISARRKMNDDDKIGTTVV